MIHGPGNKGNLNLLYRIQQKGFPYTLADRDRAIRLEAKMEVFDAKIEALDVKMEALESKMDVKFEAVNAIKHFGKRRIEKDIGEFRGKQ